MMQPFCTIIKKFLKRHSTVIQVSQTPDLVIMLDTSIHEYDNDYSRDLLELLPQYLKQKGIL